MEPAAAAAAADLVAAGCWAPDHLAAAAAALLLAAAPGTAEAAKGEESRAAGAVSGLGNEKDKCIAQSSAMLGTAPTMSCRGNCTSGDDTNISKQEHETHSAQQQTGQAQMEVA
jgi:hypothetical protein